MSDRNIFITDLTQYLIGFNTSIMFYQFQSVIQMPGFRSLGDEEEVEFECKESEKGLEATRVSGPSSVDCQGSHRRPLSKKRFRKIRSDTSLLVFKLHFNLTLRLNAV